MDAHPLRGAVRFPIYPLLALGAGCLPGVFVDLYSMKGFHWTFLFGALGGAVGVAWSISARWWMGLLIAPMLGTVGIVVFLYTLNPGWTWEYVLSGVYPGLRRFPSPAFCGFVLTVPLLALHRFRLRWRGTWPAGWLLYAAAAASLWLLKWTVDVRVSTVALAVLVLFNLGSRAAWEYSLKLSGAQLGSPSSRLASS